MKKSFFILPLMALAMTLVACDPSHDNEGPKDSASSEALTSQMVIKAKSEGNNNLTVYTEPTRYIWVYDAKTNNVVGNGTAVKIQIAPPTEEVTYYITTHNQDGSIVKSGTKSIKISEYTDLPEIYNQIFGDGKGGFTTTKWGWDTEASDGVWGNGAYLENTGPGWWVVSASDIDAQAEGKGLSNDGLNGWMELSLSGVKTSRGETGNVVVTQDIVKAGWDIGKMVFSGTTPLMGIQPNVGGNQYDYHILKADGTTLRLCAPEPGAGDWGTAWFWNFKKL